MLRLFVVALGVSLLVGAGLLLVVHGAWPVSIELAVLGSVILAGTLFEGRYRTRRATTEEPWQVTGERFTDPTSGKMMEVRFNPRTGERVYVETT